MVTLPWSKPLGLGKGQFEDFTDPGEVIKSDQRRMVRSRRRGQSRPPQQLLPASSTPMPRPPPPGLDDEEELIPDEVPGGDSEDFDIHAYEKAGR